MPIKTSIRYCLRHNGHHWKDLQRINTVENVQKKKSSYNLGRNVDGEATMENIMDVPWNTKQRGIIWSEIPFLDSGPEKNHHSKWHVHLNFQGNTIYNSQDIESTKTSSDRNVKAMRYIYTLEYSSVVKQNEMMTLAAAWMNQEIIALCEASQRQICDMYGWNL